MPRFPLPSLLLLWVLTGCGAYGWQGRQDDRDALTPPLVVVVETVEARATRGLDLGQATTHLAAQIERCSPKLRAHWVLSASMRAQARVKCQVVDSSADGIGGMIQARVHLSCVVETSNIATVSHREDTVASYQVGRQGTFAGSAVDPTLLQRAEQGALLRASSQIACPLVAPLHTLTPQP